MRAPGEALGAVQTRPLGAVQTRPLGVAQAPPGNGQAGGPREHGLAGASRPRSA
ncbi:MAG: hypothetical protein ACYCU3_07685 [Streptosporangiaceae bacterium]